jgi:hypothetical protein
LVALIAAVALIAQIFFIVDEREQVIITQFGGYLRTIDQPGLAVKARVRGSTTWYFPNCDARWPAIPSPP